MAYNLKALHKAVTRRLESQPMATLSDLSREFKTGARTIEKAVALNAGIPFRELRRNLLLRKACDLLDEPGRSVKEVSFFLGFSSPKSFARFIKCASGRTATEIRRAVHESSVSSS
jgi:AraC-like DNA-binding protein